MDAVITYCNGEDKNFQELYSKYKNDKATSSNRWRDLGTFRYVLRGIDKYMSFIEKVFVIVKFESQIPEWLNTDNVNIVYESDIMPNDILPVFNSTAIELFLHKIPGISNEFIYFNDDMIPYNFIEKEDFIKDGKILCRLYDTKFNKDDKDIHYHCLYNGCKVANVGKTIDDFLFPEHFPYAFFKNEMDECYNLNEQDILNSITTFRDYKNLDHSLYLFYCFHKNKVLNRTAEIGTYTEIWHNDVLKKVADCEKKLLCVNDAGKKDDEIIENINKLLEEKFPDKCKFEK